MLSQLKMLLGIKDSSQDDLLGFILDSVSDEVKNYCNLEEIPAALERLTARMAADLYRLEGYGSAEGASGIASEVKRGDVTTVFSSVGGNFNSITGAGGADFLKNYAAQLQAFRKVRW